MAPKPDVMRAVEALQRDVERIEVLEKSIEEMRQQMGKLSVLYRLKQHLNEMETKKKLYEECVIGSVTITGNGKQKEMDDPESATITGQLGTTSGAATSVSTTVKMEVADPMEGKPQLMIA